MADAIGQLVITPELEAKLKAELETMSVEEKVTARKLLLAVDAHTEDAHGFGSFCPTGCDMDSELSKYHAKLVKVA